MPVFPIVALDGFIQPRAASIASGGAMETNGHHAAAERKPPFSLYSFYPLLYVIPPQQPLPSPSAPSSSPYIVKHKRRSPRQSVAEHQRIASDIGQNDKNVFASKRSSYGGELDCEGVRGSARSAWLEQQEGSDIFEIEINGDVHFSDCLNQEDLECFSLVSSSTGDEFFDAPDTPLGEGSHDEFDMPMISLWQDEAARHTKTEELIVARIVHAAVARGVSRAEKEEEIETLLACKSKEIARLKDKLQYYEIVNHEMSQRNQEAVEMAQRRRRRHRKRQKWGLCFITGAAFFSTAIFLTYKADKYWNLRLGSLTSHLSAKQGSGLGSAE